MTEDAAITQQRALYGASLAQLTGDVMASFGLSQAALARILGLSAPMLSQLISGHRVKIGNPAAVHRLQALVALAPRSALARRAASGRTTCQCAGAARASSGGRR